MAAMLTTIGSVVTQMVTWVGNVISSLFGTDGVWADVAPFLYIGTGITILLTAVGIVRSFVYGRG